MFNGAAEPDSELISLFGRPADVDVPQPVPMQPAFHLIWFHPREVFNQVQLRSWGDVAEEEDRIREISICSSLMLSFLPVTKNVIAFGFTGASPSLPNCNIDSLEVYSISDVPSLFLC